MYLSLRLPDNNLCFNNQYLHSYQLFCVRYTPTKHLLVVAYAAIYLVWLSMHV